MLQETVGWLTILFSLGCIARMWQEVRQGAAGRKLNAEERQQIFDGAQSAQAKIESEAVDAGKKFVIAQEVLDAVVDDITKAQDRFIEAIKDTEMTTGEIDQEYLKAREKNCIHIQKIRELNRGVLPTAQLKLISESWCE